MKCILDLCTLLYFAHIYDLNVQYLFARASTKRFKLWQNLLSSHAETYGNVADIIITTNPQVVVPRDTIMVIQFGGMTQGNQSNIERWSIKMVNTILGGKLPSLSFECLDMVSETGHKKSRSPSFVLVYIFL